MALALLGAFIVGLSVLGRRADRGSYALVALGALLAGVSLYYSHI